MSDCCTTRDETPAASAGCGVPRPWLAAAALVLAGLAAPAAADDPDPFLDRWRWVHFGPDSGLPTSRVSEVTQTAADEVWVSTASGVHSYDGFRWERAGAQFGLPAGSATLATADLHGGILAIVANRLFRGGRGGFDPIRLTDGDAQFDVVDAAPLGPTRVLAIGRKGEFGASSLWICDAEGAHVLATGSGPDLGAMPRVWRTTSGNVWLAAKTGLFVWDGTGWRPRFGRCDSQYRVADVAETTDGSALVSVLMPAEDRGLWELVPGEDAVRIDSMPPRAVALDPSGFAITAYDSGEVRIRRDGAWGEPAAGPRGLRNVASMTFRSNGDLWVGTETGLALFKASSTRWTRWHRGHGDSWNNVNAILRTRDGSICLATEAGLEIRRPDGSVNSIGTALGTSLAGATGVEQDEAGNLWVVSGGSFTGAYRFDGRVWRRFDEHDGLRARNIHAVRRDRQGRLWFLGLTSIAEDPQESGPGAFVWDGASFTRWSVEDGLPDGSVYSFAEGRDGCLWFGTRRGLARWDHGRWTRWTTEDGLPNSKVFALAIDGRDRVWLSLQDSGLAYVDGEDRIRPVTADDGLPADSVWDIRADADGNLWASTYGGIWFHGRDTWAVFGTQSGLDLLRAWPILPCDDRVYLGTSGGGTYVLDLAERLAPAPRVALDEPAVTPSRVLLRWSVSSYWGRLLPNDITTRWRLDGGPWSAFTHARETTFEGLEPGPHAVDVESKGLFGDTSTQPYSAGFVVAAPLWRRSEFAIPVASLATLVVALVVLLTARRARHAREMRLAAERLADAQRMESIGRLAGGVAHDFNNLLTVIMGFSALAKRRVVDDPATVAQIDQVMGAADRAAALTRDLLAFGRRQAITLRVLDLNAVVSSVEEMVRRVIGPDIEVVVKPSPAIRRVNADENQLGQVLLNLAANARDAMPQGGRFTIETSEHRPGEVARRDARRGPSSGNWVVLSVSDTGTGMDEATRERVFEPFFTTKGVGRGTGLGLSSVYGIVKQAGGDVQVDSEPGVGTTFRIYLSAAELESQRADEPRPPLSAPPPTGRRTILLVDDEDGVRTFARDVLVADGHHVLVARDADEAAACWTRSGATIDMLITDVGLPRADGRELAARFSRAHPDAGVAFISGYTGAAPGRSVQVPEGAVLLAKPFSPAELRRTLERLDADRG